MIEGIKEIGRNNKPNPTAKAVEQLFKKNGYKNIMFAAGKVQQDKKDPEKGTLDIMIYADFPDGPKICLKLKESLNEHVGNYAMSRILKQMLGAPKASEKKVKAKK